MTREPAAPDDPARVLGIWTVYHGATDHPHGYIARRFEIRDGWSGPTADVMVEPELDLLRQRLAARGLVNLGRQPDDEPHIVECWI